MARVGVLTKSDLEVLMGHVADWPDEAQNELLEAIGAIQNRYPDLYRLSPEELEAVEESRREVRQGRFASEESVAALFDRYRG